MAAPSASTDVDGDVMMDDQSPFASEKPELAEVATAETVDADVEQRPAKRSKKAKKAARREEVQTYENGVIRVVEVQNFMNHSHLRIELDPHVNFIVGKNGSGKSAIVNALIAGFGHRASSTGRNTNSTKNLIKHGADYALISVHLANGGEDAWKADEFGDTIVAERRIERTGGGSYKLKDGPDGVARRSTHGEFEALCQHFNIQANNPCALLTQEHAKKFLHNGNADDRYRFFLQAANLESRKHDLAQTEQNVSHLREKLERAHEAMAEKEEIARKATADFEGAKKLKEIQKQIDLFESLLGWALVGDKERELEEMQAAMRAALEKEALAKESTFEADDRRKQLEEALADAEKRKKLVDKELETFCAKAEKHHVSAKQTLKEMKAAKKRVEEMRGLLEDARGDADHYAEQYETALAALEGTTDARQRQLLQQTTEVTERHAATQKAVAELTDQKNEAYAAYNAAVDAWRESKRAFEAAEEEAKSKDIQLKEMAKSGNSRHVGLHPSLPELLAQLKKRRAEFKVAPVGPIALHLSVKPEFESFGLAVEAAIGRGQLLTWLVSCQQDEVKLRSILKALQPAARRRPLNDETNIVVRQPEPRYVMHREQSSDAADDAAEAEAAGHDVVPASQRRASGRRSSAGVGPSSSEPPAMAAGAPSLIDAVEITSSSTVEADMVFNHLLDGCRAENKMLFVDLDEAERVTYASSDKNVEGVACVTRVTGSTREVVARRFFRRGATSAAEGLAKPSGVITRDEAAMRAQLAADAEAARQNARRLQGEALAADKARKDAEAKEKGVRKGLKAAEETLLRLEDDKATLEGETAESSVTAEITRMQRDKVEAANKATQYEAELSQREAEVADLEQRFQPLKAKNEENQQVCNEITARAEEAANEVEAALAPLTKSKTKMSQVRKALAEAEKEKKEAEARCSELKEYIEGVVPQVEDMYGARVHDPEMRDVATLKKEKNALEVRQKKEQQRQGGKTLEELAQKAEMATKMAAEGRDDLQKVSQIGESQAAAFKERSKYFRKEAKALGKTASLNFNQRLSRKNHAGRLHFDHENEMLSIEVTRNSQDTDSAATLDARNLSGGERSFTTLAFELAMWEFCATPFRVLDEFDVFMDDTYRKQAVETLLELCDLQPHRQFLFVTPQDMHPFLTHRLADASKTMPTITKMKDPRPKGAAS